jgi:hypothetical protein
MHDRLRGRHWHALDLDGVCLDEEPGLFHPGQVKRAAHETVGPVVAGRHLQRLSTRRDSNQVTDNRKVSLIFCNTGAIGAGDIISRLMMSQR